MALHCGNATPSDIELFEQRFMNKSLGRFTAEEEHRPQYGSHLLLSVWSGDPAAWVRQDEVFLPVELCAPGPSGTSAEGRCSLRIPLRAGERFSFSSFALLPPASSASHPSFPTVAELQRCGTRALWPRA